MTREQQIEQEKLALLRAIQNCSSFRGSAQSLLRMTDYLYDAGFRKQQEGEWIKHLRSYECSLCNQEIHIDGFAEDFDPVEDYSLHFCYYCGAKMKGADDEQQ